jgi:hypothetical protein
MLLCVLLRAQTQWDVSFVPDGIWMQKIVSMGAGLSHSNYKMAKLTPITSATYLPPCKGMAATLLCVLF